MAEGDHLLTGRTVTFVNEETEDVVVPEPHRARPAWLVPWLVGGLVIVLIVAAGATYLLVRSRGLATEDPAGARACAQLSDWLKGKIRDPKTGKPEDSFTASAAIGEAAEDSTTPAIRQAAGEDLMDDPAMTPVKDAGGPKEFRMADLREMHAACVSAGVDMPAYAVPR